MPLTFSGTRDQALITEAVRAATANGDPGRLGRGALQYILYFLQQAGVPVRYTFDAYYSGPSCDRIFHDAERLVADGVLEDTSPHPEKYSNFRPGAVDELLQLHAAALQPHLATIEKVVHVLLPLQDEHLELLVALDYFFRWLKAGGGPGPWKERVIERFLQVEKDKFPRAAVEAAYDAMVDANLLEA
jgi:hypothetical protein